jgi:FkbM family methyltransferase
MSLHSLLLPQRLTEIVDIGACSTDDLPPYKPMLDAGLCRVTGFEPHPESFEQLMQTRGPQEHYFPFVVGDGKRHNLTLYPGRRRGMSSLFEVDPAIFALFPEFIACTKSPEMIEVQTQKLDDITEIQSLDYLKIDIQGGELAVFQSGKARLANAVVVQTEVSFITIYKGQPTFAEVDFELRGQGFLPHCFPSVLKWPIYPNIWRPLNQLLEADIVYVRDFIRCSMNDEQLKHLALIAHHCYRSFDLALHCIMLLERRGVLSGAQKAYRSSVASMFGN